MTQVRDVQRTLKPLLAQHDDLAIADRMLILTPIRHHLRAVFVARTSSADDMDPRWFTYGLFHPRLDIHLSWGHLLYNPNPETALWMITDPDVPRVLREQIEQVALPILRPVESLQDFVAFIRKGETLPGQTSPYWCMHHPEDILVMHIALGELDQARALAVSRMTRWPKQASPKDADVTINQIAGISRLLRLLADDDRAGMIAALHEWESATVRKLRLEAHWAPSPFPLEAIA